MFPPLAMMDDIGVEANKMSFQQARVANKQICVLCHQPLECQSQQTG